MHQLNPEKRFNFPDGLVRVIDQPGNRVDIVQNDVCLLSTEHANGSLQDNFYWDACCALYECLIDGAKGIPAGLLDDLREHHEKGTYRVEGDPFDRFHMSGEFEPGEQATILGLEGLVTVDPDLIPEDGEVFLDHIELELANGERYRLHPDFEAMFLYCYDFLPIETGDVMFCSDQVDLGMDLRENVYHPSDYRELCDAKVVAVVLVRHDHANEIFGELADELILSVGFDVIMVRGPEWRRETILTYESRKEKADIPHG